MKRKLTVLIIVMSMVLFIIPAGAQSFTFETDQNYVYSEPIDSTLDFVAIITNLTGDNIFVKAERSIIYSPHAWSSQMCLGYCYDVGISITNPYLIMGSSTGEFVLHVNITEGIVDYAEIQIRMIRTNSDGTEEYEDIDIVFTASTNPDGIFDVDNLQSSYTLKQNYPNPFNPITNIDYYLPINSNVELKIYNAVGQKIKTLINKNENAGNHSISWDATNHAGAKVPSGIYFYVIKAGNFSQINKMLLLK